MKYMRWATMIIPSLIAVLFLTTGCEKEDNDEQPVDLQELEYRFDESNEDWMVGFADYPEGEEDFYELDYGHSPLPAPLDSTNGSLMITGNNHSDDLFMYLYHRVENLFPNSEYEVFFDLSIASNAAESSFGVGGSPGSSVYLKAGAVNEEPAIELGKNDHYFINLDKGFQSTDGDDMMNIGNISNGTEEFVYTLIQRGNTEPFRFTTGSDGSAWIIIGTDSGFEATTTLFYDQINVKLEKVE